MDTNKLFDLTSRQRATSIHLYGDDRGLLLFLHYIAYKRLRNDLMANYLFEPDPTGNRQTFKYQNVTVSWSPAIEQVDGYVFGRETLT